MVTQLGMSDVGSIVLNDGDYRGPSYSEAVGSKIDDAIRALSDEGYKTALTLIIENRACLDKIAEEMVETETITGNRLREIVSSFTNIPEKVGVV